MRVRRRFVLYTVLLGVVVLLGLSACGGGGGGGKVQKPAAWVHLAVLPGGDAQLDLSGAGRLRTDAELQALAQQIAGDIFPGTRDLPVRTETSRGYPYARVDIVNAYRPGRETSLRIDTRTAWRRLTDKGFSEAALRLWLPSVSATVRTSGTETPGTQLWLLRTSAPAPVVEVDLRPRPMLWCLVMVLPLLALAGVVLGAGTRRRGVALYGSACAVLAGAATVVVSGGKQGDQLGVAGVLDGEALTVASLAPLAALPLGVVGAIVLAVTLKGRHPASRPQSSTKTGP